VPVNDKSLKKQHYPVVWDRGFRVAQRRSLAKPPWIDRVSSSRHKLHVNLVWNVYGVADFGWQLKGM